MRRLFGYTLAILILGALYLGWVYHSRKTAEQKLIERLQSQAPVQNEKVVDAYGGAELTILSFYASPGAVRRGEAADLCYSVSNAVTVQLEPPVADVWPSLSRCVKVRPDKDTEYVFTARAGDGRDKSVRLTLKVLAE